MSAIAPGLARSPTQAETLSRLRYVGSCAAGGEAPCPLSCCGGVGAVVAGEASGGTGVDSEVFDEDVGACVVAAATSGDGFVGDKAEAAEEAVGDAVCDVAEDVSGEEVVRNGVRAAVGEADWVTVGDAVGEAVWDDVGADIRDAVGDIVGADVRDSVGNDVRGVVGENVRAAVTGGGRGGGCAPAMGAGAWLTLGK
mmetsp:Transcript_31561/g.59366  ORF Transcript_31561/g.59366 Transcript_31561/m.59366 type:complete len:197 (-) Transcript_31561:3-593(-)